VSNLGFGGGAGEQCCLETGAIVPPESHGGESLLAAFCFGFSGFCVRWKLSCVSL